MKKKILIGFMTSVMLLSSVMVGCGSGKGSGSTKEELVVVDWGGANTDARTEAIIKPFEEKYNCKVTVVTPTDYGKMKTMVENGTTEWDVVNVDSDFVIRGGEQGLLEPIDYNVVKSAKDIKKDLQNEYGVGSEIYSSVISYNTNTFSEDNAPKTWADFWDTKKFPGKRAMWKYPVSVLEAALLADGVDPKNLYPLDVDRAFKKLDEIKPEIKVWWTEGAQAPQLLANGEVAMTLGWSGRITGAKTQGSPEDITYNQGLVFSASWVVPKGAPHKELAMKFIDFATQPEQHLAFSKNIDYGSTNSKAVEMMDNDLKNKLGQTDEQIASQVYIDNEWWVKNFDEVNKRFQEWLVK